MMYYRAIMALMAFVTFLGFVTYYEHNRAVLFDQWASDLLQGKQSIIIFHYIGEPIFVVFVALALFIWLWLRERNYRAMMFVLLTVAAGNVVNQLLKRWIERPRPEIVDQLLSYSFPSGHAMNAILYWMTIAYLLSKVLRQQKYIVTMWIIALVLSFLIGLSRIAESRHFATDVIAGWSAGYIWFYISVLWYESRDRRYQRSRIASK